MQELIDPFQRKIEYLRVSITDRCDFRCVYCMSEDIRFLPKKSLLTLEEMDRLCSAFVRLGVRKLRLTGGEPLVRRGAMSLIEGLGRHLGSGLDELTLTTNASQLARFAEDLYKAGIRRLNVSLDTLDPELFRRITRWGRLEQVLEGIRVAKNCGLAIKINCVVLKHVNHLQASHLLEWCVKNGYDLTFIEVMPMGDLGTENRVDQFWPLSQLRTQLAKDWNFTPSAHKTGGPARYFDLEASPVKLGFITPMTHHFCESCNRVRLTCSGKLYLCLGQDDMVDLSLPLRQSESDDLLEQAIIAAIARKPKGHDFVISRHQTQPSQTRHMSVTGG
ncbi:MAG: GTP 3',8-cyclase MoaA [Pseudomonadota bacterium]